MAQSLPIHHFYTFLFTVNVIRQMAPLFSKVDSNKLWHDVQHEENVICAQFGKDLFDISKVIGRKKWPSFLTHSVHIYTDTVDAVAKLERCIAVADKWMAAGPLKVNSDVEV